MGDQAFAAIPELGCIMSRSGVRLDQEATVTMLRVFHTLSLNEAPRAPFLPPLEVIKQEGDDLAKAATALGWMP